MNAQLQFGCTTKHCLKSRAKEYCAPPIRIVVDFFKHQSQLARNRNTRYRWSGIKLKHRSYETSESGRFHAWFELMQIAQCISIFVYTICILAVQAAKNRSPL